MSTAAVNDRDPPLTAAELLRRKARAETEEPRPGDGPSSTTIDADIDDEIERLEQELLKSSGSSDSEESDSDDSSTHQGAPPRQAVITLSHLRDDRIEPLPATCLPTLTSKRIAAVDSADGKRSKRPKPDHGGSHPGAIDPEVKETVQTLLNHYVPRSRDRLPFYCRYCQHQYSNETEFLQHRTESEVHKAAVQAERRATYCKLCQKQMTSPTQMQEHLQSKPHKEKLEYRKQQQQQQPRQQRRSKGESWPAGGRVGPGPGHHGRHHPGRGSFAGRGRPDTRQWK